MPDFYYYVQRLDDNNHFSFVKIGDGEFACIFGKSGATCDGQEYSSDLSLELQRILLSPHKSPFHYSMSPIAVKTYKKEIDAYILENDLQISWCDAAVFVKASHDGKLFPFIHALRYKKIIYVGPAFLRKLNTIGIPYEYFVEVPRKNAWLRRDTITAMIKASVKTLLPDVICFSAGPLSKVLIYDLYEIYQDSLTMIDIGSLFDGFLGNYSRKYMKMKQWQKFRKRNLGL